MHPRTLGPYALQMQRLIILTCALAAIFITIISGPNWFRWGFRALSSRSGSSTRRT